MSAITYIPSIKLINSDESLDATLEFLVRVAIAIQHPYHFRGEVIAAGVPLQPLKEIALTVLEYLTIDGAQINFPRSEAVDWTLLLNLIDLIIDKHCSGEVFELDPHELLQDPLKSVKLHIILKLFGLNHQANILLKQLWLVFETHTLTLAEVFWFYGALVPPKSTKWVPELTKVYLQMMAWNLLNADAEGRLHPDLRTFFLEEEGKPYHLTRLLEEHLNKYGLGREELEIPGTASRKRRDTATERTEVIVSPCNSSTPASTPDPLEGPIFGREEEVHPAGKRPPKPIDIRALLPDEKWDSKKWNCMWDRKVKDVQMMALEREGLVSLRRSQAFLKKVGPEPVYVEFGYPGWCDERKPREKWNGI
jgi:hypothetical protein